MAQLVEGWNWIQVWCKIEYSRIGIGGVFARASQVPDWFHSLDTVDWGMRKWWILELAQGGVLARALQVPDWFHSLDTVDLGICKWWISLMDGEICMSVADWIDKEC